MDRLSDYPMSLLDVEFEELYQRHLCRHSQFGINVIHLIALFGTWYSAYGIIYWLIPSPWTMVVLGVSFLVMVVSNLPVLVFATTIIFVTGVCTLVYYGSLPWYWSYFVIFLLSYKIPQWSHKIYKIENDMTKFNQKYPPSTLLFFILLLYEVPIILNYLVFRYQDWK
ncbi:hypothetical protein Riv7116_1646 [Rivularia sp. PCC 7116]|uniref:hypothetical protein n=1 Tax=Rivularia sp. PCC 7116 TaxID=373994 RepID=UPI00029F3B99|nr:hypothetical protein [Rivularia sp. PCC 7116]AFY54198.1 hypothetical protein Riv7116_1646 [Rivularia sp. PCC 7116]